VESFLLLEVITIALTLTRNLTQISLQQKKMFFHGHLAKERRLTSQMLLVKENFHSIFQNANYLILLIRFLTKLTSPQLTKDFKKQEQEQV